jgi:4-amino-4-deoxy-L-arabinose transferase-like glycosyltransferase
MSAVLMATTTHTTPVPNALATKSSLPSSFPRKLALLFLLLLSAVMYIGTAGGAALLDDADASHALVPREMMERHDYVVMFLNGVRYLQKAPIHYWMVVATYKIFGQTEFAVRFPVALAMIGLTLMAFEFGRRFFGERAGLYAALATCTSAGMYMFTRIMIPEAIYALQFTVIFYLFLRAWNHEIDPRLGYWGIAALTGCAVLTRGLIGVVFPVGTIVAFVLFTGGWRRWRELHLFSSVLIFLAIAVPWHWLAELRAPGGPTHHGFLWSYFINEHVKRALGTRWPPDYDATPLPVWWVAHLAWFFPWSVFLPLAGKLLPSPKTWWKPLSVEAQARLMLFTWAAVILGFFSVVTGSRMEYYAFGAWPACTILIGLGMARAEERGSEWLTRLAAGLAVLGVVLSGVLTWAVWQASRIRASGDISTLLKTHPTDFYRLSMGHLFDLTPEAFADLRTPALMAAACFFVAFLATWLFLRKRRVLQAALVLGIGMGVFFFAANMAFKVFEPHMSSRPLANAILKYLQPQDRLAIYGEFDPASSVSFYTHRKAWIVNGRYNNLELGSYYPDCPKIFVTDADFPAFWSAAERTFLVVPPEQREKAAQRMPPDHTWVLIEEGGKIVYVNQPITPGQKTIGELAAETPRS